MQKEENRVISSLGKNVHLNEEEAELVTFSYHLIFRLLWENNWEFLSFAERVGVYILYKE